MKIFWDVFCSFSLNRSGGLHFGGHLTNGTHWRLTDTAQILLDLKRTGRWNRKQKWEKNQKSSLKSQKTKQIHFIDLIFPIQPFLSRCGKFSTPLYVCNYVRMFSLSVKIVKALTRFTQEIFTKNSYIQLMAWIWNDGWWEWTNFTLIEFIFAVAKYQKRSMMCL